MQYTLAKFLYWAESLFAKNNLVFGHGTNNAWDEAVALALYVLKLSPNADQKVLQYELKTQEQKKLISLAKLRIKLRKPVPYLTHEAWFNGEKYYVDERVIIPRSPFAELIKNKFKPFLKKEPRYILDLCTGSGCMAIACAKAFTKAMVTAVDLAEDALEVAYINVKKHKCSSRIKLIKSDLFDNLKVKPYNLIISNPPYVATKELKSLPKEYLYEPKLALISGKDGLTCTKRILQRASLYLAEDGLLFIEVGNSYKILEKLYTQIPFKWIKFKYGGEGVFMLTKKQLKGLI